MFGGRYSGYLEKYPVPRDSGIFISPNTFSRKLDNYKKSLKNLFCLNCNLWHLPNWYSRKQENLSNLNPKEKKSFASVAANTFLRKVDTPKTCIAPKKFEKTTLLDCDVWSLTNWHSWKEVNMSNLNPKEEKNCVVERSVVVKLWPLISPKPTFSKIRKSE